MNIDELNPRPGIENNAKLNKTYTQFDKLLIELRKRKLPDAIVIVVNRDIAELNAVAGLENEWKKLLKKKQTKIIKLLEKELKLVPENYYRNIWLALGMAAFGVPLGVAFGTSMGNMAFLGIGIPIGLAIGLSVGSAMDNKALAEDRQLNFEIKS